MKNKYFKILILILVSLITITTVGCSNEEKTKEIISEVRGEVSKYLEEEYPVENYKIKHINDNAIGIDGSVIYTATRKSKYRVTVEKVGKNSDFQLIYDMKKKEVIEDNEKDYPDNKSQVLKRLAGEYEDRLNSIRLPIRGCDISLSIVLPEFNYETWNPSYVKSDYIDYDMTLDEFLNEDRINKKYKISVWVFQDDIDVSEIIDNINQIHEMLIENEIDFNDVESYSFSCKTSLALRKLEIDMKKPFDINIANLEKLKSSENFNKINLLNETNKDGYYEDIPRTQIINNEYCTVDISIGEF